MKFEIEDKVVVNQSVILEELANGSNADKKLFNVLVKHLDDIGNISYVDTNELGSEPLYLVTFSDNTSILLDGKYLTLNCLDKLNMEYQEIGKVVTYFKLGEPLEWYDTKSGTWKDSKADSLNEIMYNILECSTMYRVK